MKIFIEGTPLFSNTRSGVGHYNKELTEAMLKLKPQNEYTIFGFHFILKGRAKLAHDIHKDFLRKYVRLLPGRGYNLLYKKGLRLPIDVLLRATPDIVFYGNFAYWPLWTRAKSVIVVHDLAFQDPEFMHSVEIKNRRFLQKFVPYSIKKADHVIAVSEYSRQQVISVYGTDPDKVSVVYPGIDTTEYYPRTKQEVDEVRRKFKLPKDYLLFLSTLEPRKNVVGLLDAFAALPAEIQQKHPLVLVGGKGWNDEEIFERLETYKHLPIIRPGYVPYEDLPALYTGAHAFVFPSYYEGFGIAPLDAMSCGTPVLTSNTTSLPEVTGKDAAVLVNPHDTQEITDGIIKIVGNEQLRKRLIKNGFERAKLFGWDKSAKKALDIFESLVDERERSS